MADQQIDILIIGGGLVGATLMLALRDLGYQSLLVESRPLAQQVAPYFDARSLALAPASKRILSMLGAWDLLNGLVTPIERIHISQQQGFGATRLQAEKNSPLGYVVEIQDINSVLQQMLDPRHMMAPATLTHLDLQTHQATIETSTGPCTLNAKLIVAADGVHSTVRTLCGLPVKVKQFNQQAIVANIGLSRTHSHQAFERFTPEGPVALLPMQGNKMSLIWAMAPQKANQLMEISDRLFLDAVHKVFGYRLGKLTQVGQRVSYPLQQRIMPKHCNGSVVFVGNAAHTLHPVAGQGFNLGLRDVAMLAQCIAQFGLNEKMLPHYELLRRRDHQNIIRFTNGLITLFTSRFPGVKWARDLGLVVLDNSRLLKYCLSRQAQGYGGIIPDLVSQIALENNDETTL